MINLSLKSQNLKLTITSRPIFWIPHCQNIAKIFSPRSSGAPLCPAPGDICPPCPPPRYATEVDSRSPPLLVTFDPGVSTPRSKIEKSITCSTVVSPVRQTRTTVANSVCSEKQAAAWSVTVSVVNYLYFAVTAGVVNGDGYSRKIVDMNPYKVLCILCLKIHCQKSRAAR